MRPLSLYIHFPWCIRKCPYCDFNSHEAKAGIPEQQYISALLADLQHDLTLLAEPRHIQSIFMGGGTPSLFSAEALQTLLQGIQQLLPLTANCEITLEANPGSFESSKFKAYRELGINRLSIGIQSFNDPHLQKLGRVHNSQEAVSAVHIAKQAGFDNFNLDFMFGLPGQTIADALQDIQTAIALQPTHLSFYQLTLEPNTYFYKFPPRLPDDEIIFDIQQACQQLLAEHNYAQYEVSAYAKPGYQSRHNCNYWQFGDYLGIGAGAHGKISLSLPDKIIRTSKLKHPEQYLQSSCIDQHEVITLPQLPLEFVMNHLRLKTGFTLTHYQQATGLAVDSLQPALAECVTQGLLVFDGEQVYCSVKGWDFLDAVLEMFLV